MKIRDFFKKKRSKYSETGMLIRTVYLLLGSIFFPTFFSSLLFIFNISITSFHYIISIMLLFVSYCLLFYDVSKNKRDFIIPIVICVLINCFSILMSNLIYETSWDGWYYHTPSVVRLKNGWNPLYQHDDQILTWITHYPKFIWIYGANLYSTFGNMFLGTSFNLTIAFSLLFITLYVLQKYKVNKIISIIMSIVFAFNPITVGQLFSYYNDGVLGICIISLLLLFSLALDKKEDLSKSVIWYVIVMDASILASTKFTGALFALIIVVIYFLLFFILRIMKFNKKVFFYIITMGLGVLIVASNTYLPNYIHHKNVGYPLIGENKKDIITQFTPATFADDSNLKSFIKSATMLNSSKSGSSKKYTYSPIYIINYDDVMCASVTDCRVGAFGPQYQMILILSVVIFVGTLFSKKNLKLLKENKRELFRSYRAELAVFIVSLIMFYIVPATWWMRYVPFMYLVPIMMIMKRFDMKNNAFINACMHILIFICILFALIFVSNRFSYAKKRSDTLKIQIESAINDINKGYKVAELNHRTYYYKIDVRKTIFDELNVKYEETDDSSCEGVGTYASLGIMTVKCGGEKK